jgi:hypothetical protein
VELHGAVAKAGDVPPALAAHAALTAYAKLVEKPAAPG